MKKKRIGREKFTNRNIFLYFDIFEKLYLKTAIKYNREGGVRAKILREKSRI